MQTHRQNDTSALEKCVVCRWCDSGQLCPQHCTKRHSLCLLPGLAHLDSLQVHTHRRYSKRVQVLQYFVIHTLALCGLHCSSWGTLCHPFLLSSTSPAGLQSCTASSALQRYQHSQLSKIHWTFIRYFRLCIPMQYNFKALVLSINMHYISFTCGGSLWGDQIHITQAHEKQFV